MLEKFFNYTVYSIIGCFCIITAIIQLLLIENFNFFLFSCFVGSFTTIYIYFYILQNKKNILDFFSLLSFSIGFGYCLSSYRYLLIKDISSFKELNTTLMYDLYPDAYSSGMAAILVSMGVLIFLSLVTKGIYISENIENYIKQVKSFFVISFIFLIFCIITGKLSFQWSYNSNEEVAGLDPISGIASMLLPLTMISSIIFYNHNKKYIIVMLLSIILLVLTGRRNLLFALMMVPVFMNYFSFNIDLKWFFKKIYYVAFSVGVFLFLSFYFVALRVVSWQRIDYSLFDNLLAGFHVMFYQTQDVIEALGSTDDRSFIFNYLALLIHNSNKEQLPLYGLEFYYSFLGAIPSIFINKQSIPLAMEEYTHPLYGIPVYDAANSLLVSGLDDYYFFGMILYPSIIAIIFYYVCRLIFLKVKGSARLFIASMLIYSIFQVEQSLTGYFVSLRNIFIFIFIFIFISSVFKVRK